MSSVTVTIDRGAVESMYASPTGPVQRYLESLAQRAYDIARGSCPRGKPSPPRATVQRVPGTLANSHRVMHEGVRWFVVAETAYAVFVHEGTRPHLISPIAAPGPLAFEGSDGGMVFLRIPPHAPVNHPGTTGQPWLYQAMVAVVG